MGFLDSDDEWDDPGWQEHQEVELDAWHQILEGNQQADWDEPPNESELCDRQGTQQQDVLESRVSASGTGSPSRSPSTPRASASGTGSLARRLSETGSPVSSPVRLPVCTQDPYESLPSSSSWEDPLPVSRKRPVEDNGFETPKKVRLRFKTNPSSSPPIQQGGDEEPLPEHVIIAKIQEHTRHIKLRDFFVEHVRPEVRGTNPEMNSPAVLREVRKQWNEKSRFQQLCWCQNQLSRLFHCVPFVVDRHEAEAKRLEAEVEEKKAMNKEEHDEDFHRFRTRGCLGTWNGMWLDQKEDWKQIVRENSDEAQLRVALGECVSFQTLATEFDAFLKARCEKLGYDKWSWQFEMSTKSEDEGRLHIHAFWHSNDNRCHGGFQEAWAFRGCKPMLKHCSARGRAMQRFLDRGHYYCQTNKTGWLKRNTNYWKYSAFAVEQKWVIGLWQLRKLSHAEAKLEIVQARGHTKTYLNEIIYVEAREEEIEIEQKRAADQRRLARFVKPFREILDVELWKLQYKEVDGQPPMASRFKFLVLNGPSCYGKTQFAKALYGEKNTLLVPCQGVVQPNLKGYQSTAHRCIVFDEISSKVIVRNKALFQANTDGVLLGQSMCNEHSYWRYLYSVPMVVSCNDWLEEDLEAHEREWLIANSIVYQVCRRLWVEDGEDAMGDIEV